MNKIRNIAIAAIAITALTSCGSDPVREVRIVNSAAPSTTEYELDVNAINPDSGITIGQELMIQTLVADPATAAILCDGVEAFGADEVARIWANNASDAGIDMPISDVADVFTAFCD